jgi:hypothetical protein
MHADGSKGGVGWLNNPTGLTMVLGAERVAQLPPCMVREHPSYLLLLWSHCFSKVISMVAPTLCSETAGAQAWMYTNSCCNMAVDLCC